MSYLVDPATKPMLLRDNMFDRPCAFCGSLVKAGEGRAFMLWDERKARNTWRAAHTDERDGASCMTKVNVEHAWVPVAEAKEKAATVDALLEAPAFAMPDAEAMHQLMQQALTEAVDAIAKQTADVFTATVPSMVEEGIRQARPVTITVGDAPSVTVDRSHKALEDVLLMVVAGASPFLVGPAGSGKTTLAEQVAKCMGRPFYMASRVTSEYKLVGFTNAHGETVRTQFREAYEHGGVFLFDEVDASDPDALTTFNAALAGQWGDFPDGLVARHPDFAAIAAGNTFGRGADRQYVGRNQLDAATLDRFQTYEVDYDEELERQLAGNEPWTRYVQAVRKAIDAEKVRHVVSPRASIMGAKLLAAGMALPKVIASCIWKGMDDTTKARIVNAHQVELGEAITACERYVASLSEKEAA